MYYIAYGSNLNKEEMKQRCKDAKLVFLARLENYTLTYRGNPGRAYLTVDKKKGDFVRVAIWDVSENDKKSLDEYEDYPYLYDCFEEKVLLENNETITGFIYQMYDRFPICKPSDSYMERCKQGYKDMGWDSSILDF